MGAHSIKAIQQIPVSLAQAWEFFSDPANLQRITPGNMGFRIISRYSAPIIYAGQIIEYKLRPFAGIPVYWMTEITHVRYQEYFIDEQRFGPYRLWHPQHHFRSIEGGVEMIDLVHYKNPFGIIGRMANSLFVRKRLKEVFDYRVEKVNELLGAWDGRAATIEMR